MAWPFLLFSFSLLLCSSILFSRCPLLFACQFIFFCCQPLLLPERAATVSALRTSFLALHRIRAQGLALARLTSATAALTTSATAAQPPKMPPVLEPKGPALAAYKDTQKDAPYRSSAATGMTYAAHAHLTQAQKASQQRVAYASARWSPGKQSWTVSALLSNLAVALPFLTVLFSPVLRCCFPPPIVSFFLLLLTVSRQTAEGSVNPSTHALENHGLGNVYQEHWNLPTAALYEHAVQRGEGHIVHLGPLCVRTGEKTKRTTKRADNMKHPLPLPPPPPLLPPPPLANSLW